MVCRACRADGGSGYSQPSALPGGLRWLRWQGAVAALHHRRVTDRVRCWVASDSPEQFRPSLSWWQPFVWHYLHITG